jgi:peroxiredoxin
VLEPGDRVPDLPLLTPQGVTVSLRGFEGEATALIFLRHLG